MKDHDTSAPLFLYMAFQDNHAPNQCPDKYLSRFPELPAALSRQCCKITPQFLLQAFVHLCLWLRSMPRSDNGMMAAMDDAVGEISGAVRARSEMYSNSIMVFSTVRPLF